MRRQPRLGQGSPREAFGEGWRRDPPSEAEQRERNQPEAMTAGEGRSPVCTSQTLICPSLSPVARIRQGRPTAQAGSVSPASAAGGQALKARPHTICPHSSVFSLAAPRLLASALLPRLLRSEVLQLLGERRDARLTQTPGWGPPWTPKSTPNTHSSASSRGQGISLTTQCPCDQANQAPSGEKATLHVSQLDFQS